MLVWLTTWALLTTAHAQEPELRVYDVVAAEVGEEVAVLVDAVSRSDAPPIRTLVRGGTSADYPEPHHAVVSERALRRPRTFTLVSTRGACVVVADVELTLDSGWLALGARAGVDCPRGVPLGPAMPFRAIEGELPGAQRLVVPVARGGGDAVDFLVEGQRFLLRASTAGVEVRCETSLAYRRDGALFEAVLVTDREAFVLLRATGVSVIGTVGVRAPHCP